MSSVRLRSPVKIGLASFESMVLGCFLLLTFTSLALAQAPQPARKDSSPRAKPKDVELTTVVQPSEARAGETVTLRVTAKLKPGWHIYTQAKTQEGEGPRKTIFDLFDPAGLEIAGDWKASKAPESKPEPAFDNQVFPFFEDEVTWSIPLKVPPGTAPGKKTIRCQASYQICNAKSCSFPGRWTLPDAIVNVVAGADAVKNTQGSASPAQTPAPTVASAGPAPARKDSSLRIKPKGVTMSPSVEPAEVHPGESITYRVKASLESGWHIYAIGKEDENREGPIPTSFDFFDPAGLKVVGEWKPSKEPEARPDPAFNNLVVQYFENEVTWSITLNVPSDATPGKRSLRAQARYQICDPRSCSPPGQWTLPEVVVTVLSPGEKGSQGAASSKNPTIASKAETLPTNSAQAAPAVTAKAPAIAATPEPKPTANAKSAAEPPLSEIAQKAQQGLIPFLIASAIGGLFALVMPCVWPMVPITVNFFVKQGQTGKGKTTGLAITYCLAIIAVFTAVGVLFSFFFSASSLQNLANNPWLNLGVAALFLAFGLSLLGLFEIRLPTFLLNASARGESRGGIVGVIFMALTLTITSFTCTFPVVGGLLVMAAGGNFFYPILGLATFAAVVAFPFFLLALAPGLISKFPRSGDWMNSVKVVGGLIEIGAALKFINTAELGYVTQENAWFDAQVVLTSWIVLSVVCGVYLLGLFRTDHDHDEVRVGPGRIVFGTMFLGVALYMLPALFGRPPQSLVWDRLIIGILPPDSSEFTAAIQLAEGGNGGGGERIADVKATSTDPSQAEREEKKAHGVLWGMSFDQAREQAAAANKPILIDFTGVNCANCRLMERRVLPRPEIVNLLKEFVTIQLYTDRVQIDSITAAQREELAAKNQERLLDLAQEATNPFYVVLSPEGKLVTAIGGYNEPPVFLDFLSKALEKSRSEINMAQTPSGS